MTIDDVLNMKKMRDVLTIDGSATLDELAATLSEMNVGALVVKDQAEGIAGIVSERDIIHQYAKKANFKETTVEQVMTQEVITLKLSYDVKVAMELMCTARVRHLPVISESKLVGMVTIGDVVKAMRDTDQEKFSGFLSRFADSDVKDDCCVPDANLL